MYVTIITALATIWAAWVGLEPHSQQPSERSSNASFVLRGNGDERVLRELDVATDIAPTVGFTQLRLKKIINSPPPAINNFNWGNGRFRLPEYIAVLRI